MRVHWTDRAKQCLKRIHDHIAKDSPFVAPQVIGDAPYSGREVPDYSDQHLREILERPYRILYRIKGDRIDVIAVMHYRQLLPSDLTEL